MFWLFIGVPIPELGVLPEGSPLDVCPCPKDVTEFELPKPFPEDPKNKDPDLLLEVAILPIILLLFTPPILLPIPIGVPSEGVRSPFAIGVVL